MKNFRHLLIKLTSRKFIIAFIPTIVALMAMFGIDSDATTTFASALVTISAIVSYIATEGIIDAKGLKKKLEEYEDIIDSISAWNNKVDELNNRMNIQTTTLRDVSEVANIAYASIPEELSEASLLDTTDNMKEIYSIDIDELPLQESFDSGLADDNDIDDDESEEDLYDHQKNIIIQRDILDKCNDETIDIMKDIIAKYEKSHESKE